MNKEAKKDNETIDEILKQTKILEETKKGLLKYMMEDENVVSQLRFGDDADDLKKYISLGGDVNRIFSSSTLLAINAEYGRLEKVKILIKCSEIDVNKEDVYGTSPLYDCLSRLVGYNFFAHLECAKILTEAGAELKSDLHKEKIQYFIDKMERKRSDIDNYIKLIKSIEKKEKTQ